MFQASYDEPLLETGALEELVWLEYLEHLLLILLSPV